MRTRAILRITPELMLTMLIAMREGDEARAFRVVKNGLPQDVELVRAFVDPMIDEVQFVVSSASFKIAPDAGIHASGYPYLEPVMAEVHYPEAA